MNIQEIFELLKPLAIYKTGSSCILKEYNDVDVVVYFESKEKAHEMKKYMTLFIKNGYCPHFDYKQRLRPDCYVYHYMEKLAGEDVEKFELLDHKKEWCELVDKYIKLKSLNPKMWYRILAGAYIIDNNNYNLSEEQLANIQKVHDNKKVTKTQKEYIDKIINSNL